MERKIIEKIKAAHTKAMDYYFYLNSWK